MLAPMALFRRRNAACLLSLVCMLYFLIDLTAAATKIRDGADPSIIKIGDTYYAAQSANDKGIIVRSALTLEGLGSSEGKQVWTDTENKGAVWAPEITTDGGRTYIYFTFHENAAHRTFVISADNPLGPYSKETKLNLPDDEWAIDGALFTFEGQRYFVWSGWATGNPNEQNLYICRMKSPTEPIGERYHISRPRESWELTNGNPIINEGAEPIVDPDGQLHIVYSTNHSWEPNYCLADLRLRKGGDPLYVWDWYKSNGCLFSSLQPNTMEGWDVTREVDGPGHHTFALVDGDVSKSPEGSEEIPFVYHAVSKGEPYSWANRDWFLGGFSWWSNTTYSRRNVPGDNENTGYSFKFFE